AVIALHGHALVAYGWLIGMITFALVTWLSSDNDLKRVEFGLVSSSVAAALTFAIALRVRLAAGVVPDVGSLMEATADVPYEV
ncbi:MAG: hypothetical protein JWN39_3244, partial [Ilumatobacteraceae bacterium]|nr:hypothetical protein [Ilumatobacteraceae bacterium]